MPEPVRLPITPEGDLYDLGRYLSWKKGSAMAVLDGNFDAADLRAIADYMDANSTPS